MSGPLSTTTRLALVGLGLVAWLGTRRRWFVGDRWLGALVALFCVGLAFWDVVLWW